MHAVPRHVRTLVGCVVAGLALGACGADEPEPARSPAAPAPFVEAPSAGGAACPTPQVVGAAWARFDRSRVREVEQLSCELPWAAAVITLSRPGYESPYSTGVLLLSRGGTWTVVPDRVTTCRSQPVPDSLRQLVCEAG